MKIDVTHKEANLLMAILYELAEERKPVLATWHPMWRLTDKGSDICRSVMQKLEGANEGTGKDRDLSGAPKGTIQDSRWS